MLDCGSLEDLLGFWGCYSIQTNNQMSITDGGGMFYLLGNSIHRSGMVGTVRGRIRRACAIAATVDHLMSVLAIKNNKF
jgi:hypothetical protein